MALIKKSTMTGVGKVVGNRAPWYALGGNADWCNSTVLKFELIHRK